MIRHQGDTMIRHQGDTMLTTTTPAARVRALILTPHTDQCVGCGARWVTLKAGATSQVRNHAHDCALRTYTNREA
jgi:hypothetical protein